MKRFFSVLGSFFLLLIIATGCSWIKDDLSSCPQTLQLYFYNETPCDGKIRHPERLGQMNKIALSLFDQKGRLVLRYDAFNVVHGDNPYAQISTPPQGKYTLVCWGVSNASFYSIENIIDGSLIDQMYWTLNPEYNPSTVRLSELYYGRIDNLEIKDHTDLGSIIDTLHINMRQFTNELNLKVKGLDDLNHYTATITDDNAAYNFLGGSIKRNIVYKQYLNKTDREEYRSAMFSLLKLDRESRHPQLVITEDKSGKILYKQSVMTIIDAVALYGNAEPINFECEHVFDLSLDLEKKSDGTYMLIGIKVNGWNVVVRDVILG
ncbi:FimB/Mfa2 family fimbrial subunit [Porphyromonas pogonae]|uniref:FimB/Mfa2 family fimbrial subunit n=1 Tax=Porphyromonas pogonae TaxID=867595 RepID=UPI002E771BD4|nr:FimB/Mfa2 family fimbrial subunit [Porphyromonas pogonae]